MPVKLSMIFNVTTEAVNPTQSSPHSGGWTEGVWAPGSSFIPVQYQNSIATLRSPMLPKQASIVGFRQGIYTLSGNRILPGGTSGRKVNIPGTATWNLNLPQDSLELSGLSATSINSNRFRLGALPDEQVDRGEYAPTNAFRALVSAYCAYLIQASYWSFVGRVMSDTARVVSVAAPALNVGTVVLSAPLPGAVVNSSYMRFNRVFADGGSSVSGSWLITGFVAPATYTITGYSGYVVSEPSGTARIDTVALFPYGTVTPGRAIIKKIGRPSAAYRGRRSKRTTV